MTYTPRCSRVLFSLLLTTTFLAVACKHPVAQTPPPPPPPPPAAPPARPTVTLEASSTFIQNGQPVTLNWSSTNATSLTLSPGVGTVNAQGSTQVNPPDSTTYTITATGPGGSADSSVRITVGAATPPPVAAATPSLNELFERDVHDAFFDYDKADIRPDAREALTGDAQFLRQYPNLKIVIEGHCDERGSTEYNLALGDRRAASAKQFLVSLGISADRIDTVSYGKERPFCTASTEDCWQQNRRAHFTMGK